MNFLVVLLCYFFCISSAAQHDAKHNPSAVLLVGTVHCDTCFQELSKANHFNISVGIECLDASSEPIFRKTTTTKEKGIFRLRVISDRIKSIKSCSVKLANTNEPFCMEPSSRGTSNRLQLRTTKNGIQILSLGILSFKPLKLCNQELQHPYFFLPAPIPLLPSPPLLPPLQPPPPILPPVLPVPAPPHSGPLPPLPPVPLPPVPPVPLPPVPLPPVPPVPLPPVPLPPLPPLPPVPVPLPSPPSPPPAFVSVSLATP